MATLLAPEQAQQLIPKLEHMAGEKDSYDYMQDNVNVGMVQASPKAPIYVYASGTWDMELICHVEVHAAGTKMAARKAYEAICQRFEDDFDTDD